MGDIKNLLKGDSGKAALPEPRIVKRKILNGRENVHNAATKVSINKNVKTLNEWRESLLNLYQDIRPFLYNHTSNYKDFSDLKNLDDFIYSEDKRLTPENMLNFTRKIDLFIHDIGITDIKVRGENNNNYGFEFLRGVPFNMDTTYSNYELLKQNFKNIRKLMRKDVDIFGLVIGGNRVGKSTLSLRLTRIVKSGYDKPCLEPDDIVMSDKDFWRAANRDKYSVMHIDELSSLFYSKDSLKKKQKRRKKKLKTFAKRNMFASGCDTQFFQIDKEFVNDKVKWVVRVPQRGFFEFYSKSKVRLFDRDTDTGAVDLPEPDFTGRFPVLDDDDWSLYQLLEPDKETDVAEENDEDEESDNGQGKKLKKVFDLVLDDLDMYLKKWGDRLLVNEDLILADLGGVGKDTVRRGKEKLQVFCKRFMRENNLSPEGVVGDEDVLTDLKVYLEKKVLK